MLAVFSSASATQITPTLLVGGAIDQFQPTINATYVAWSQNSQRNTRRYNDFYETLPVGSGSPVQMNPSTTYAFVPSFDGDGNVAVLQILHRHSSSEADVLLYNLTTHATGPPPAGVNSGHWEWFPTMAQGFIEFGRNRFNSRNSPWDVMLYDPNTTSTSVLATEPYSCQCIYPGQVSTAYATWTDCPRRCDAYYYTYADASTHRIPNPRKDAQYLPSVNAATQTLYYVRAGGSCGQDVKIMRWTIGDANPTVVASLPSGYDVNWRTFDYVDGSANDNIVFDRVRCGGNYYSDVYEVAGANTASPTLLRVGSASTPPSGHVAGSGSVAGSRPNWLGQGATGPK
jgi:hypothetical protein